MKNFFFILLFSFFSIQLFAQPKEGQWVIGTMFNSFNNSINSLFESSTNFGYTQIDNDTKLFAINLAPNISKMITDKWMLSGDLSISNLSGKDTKYTGVGLGGSTRYYLKLKKFSPYLTFGTGYQIHSIKFFDSRNSKSFVIKAGIGGSYFINENASIDAVLHYVRVNNNSSFIRDNSNNVSNIGFNFGFSIFFGGKK